MSTSEQALFDSIDSPVPDEETYPYRFGALAMQARLFLLGLMPREEFVTLVNAANFPDLKPIPGGRAVPALSEGATSR